MRRRSTRDTDRERPSWMDDFAAKVSLKRGVAMWLLLVAAFGLFVPNGFFGYWLLFEYQGLGPMLADRLALGFILDVALTLAILTVYFAKHPIGPVRWPWFVAFSFMGGLGFSLPLYYWLNHRDSHGASRAFV